MSQLRPHFNSTEFPCKCGCGLYFEPPAQLLDFLEELRGLYGKPITIISGTRCQKHNFEVGGKPNSFHLTGAAVDITPDTELYELAFKICEKHDIRPLWEANHNCLHCQTIRRA